MPAMPPWGLGYGKGGFPYGKGENKVRPCPKFPSSTDQQSYKDWRRRMMHWWAQALRMGVDEGLLGNELLQALQGGPKVAQNLVARMPPQVLSSAGAPPVPLWGYPGAASGIRIALSKLDANYKRDLEDEELDALERFYKTERTGEMREFIEIFEENLEEAATRASFMCSASALSWHLIRGAKLSGLQRLLLMTQVQGDLRRYFDISFT